jgi:hypothetical protein
MKTLMIAALLLVSSGAAAQTVKTSQKAPGDKMQCKRVAHTGSLARVTKVCRTERDWRVLRENAQRDGDSLQQNARINSAAPQ